MENIEYFLNDKYRLLKFLKTNEVHIKDDVYVPLSQQDSYAHQQKEFADQQQLGTHTRHTDRSFFGIANCPAWICRAVRLYKRGERIIRISSLPPAAAEAV